MNGDLISVLMWSFLTAFGILVAVGLSFMYHKDKDKRKLMFALAFFFASHTYLPRLNTAWESIWILERLASWSILPVVAAVLIAVLSILLRQENFDKPFKAFLFTLATSIFMIIVPLPVTPELFIVSVAIGSIAMSVYLYLTRRETSILMFLLSIVCFTIGGLGSTGGLVELAVFSYFFAYVFLFLLFLTARESVKEGVSSIFALERELKSEKEKFHRLLNLLADPVAIVDRRGKILEVNDRVTELTGYEKEELLGQNFLRTHIVTAKSKAIMIKNLAKRMVGMHIAPYEIEVVAKDGRKGFAEVNAAKIEYDGKPAVLNLFRDITERKKLQQALEESEQKYRAFFENSPDGVIILDLKGNIIECNETVFEYGFRREDIIGKNLRHILPKKYWAITAKDLLSLARGQPTRGEIELNTSKGMVFVEFNSSPIKREGKIMGVQSLLRDVTERKKMDEQVKESEERLKRLIEYAPDAIYMNDLKGNFIDGNKQAENLTGYKKDELIGKNFLKLGLLPKGYTLKAAKALMKNLLGQRTGPDEFELKRKDGTLVTVEISTFPVKRGGKVEVIGIARDITERKQMQKKLEEYSQQLEALVEKRTTQLKEAQEQLLKSERLAAIGQLAAMVGHDLRNPLMGIDGATYYLKSKLGSKMDEKIREMFVLIEKDIEYSNNIITDLLEYSIEIRLEKAETSLNSIMKEALSLVKVPEKIQVSDLTQSEPKIEVDVERMKRVFVNIIKNAIDAMPEGGRLTITTKESDDSLEIAFTDTGVGMSKETLDKLWTPLFTTKAKGMGLGLSICKRFVEAHEGNITVESKVGKGTTFRVTIPIKSKLEGGETTWLNQPEYLLSTTTKA